MGFRVCARTVLELGAELISTDSIAIYELVKNAIDARSKDGITVTFVITHLHTDYINIRSRIDDNNTTVQELVKEVLRRAVSTAFPENISKLKEIFRNVRNKVEFKSLLDTAYNDLNWIEFTDTGCGMSKDILSKAFLTIGTGSRKKDIDKAIASGDKGPPPFLGEKGVGRLSAMRLGTSLHIETATVEDNHLNILDINWDDFDNLDSFVEDIHVEPTKGKKKLTQGYSGTSIKIFGLQANWSPHRLEELAKYQLARFSNPFESNRRRFRIAVVINGQRISIPRLDQDLLNAAHARIFGSYKIENDVPRLEFTMECRNLGFDHPHESQRICLENFDLKGLIDSPEEDIPDSTLYTVGTFSFDVYWYNRRILHAIESIGNLKAVRDLQAQWTSIMLFRDGYRIFPYGEEYDDWLSLDRKALGRGSYKLNTKQFVGNVSIGRLQNPFLIDQTNREGLKDCPEKRLLLELLRYAIQERLGNFMEDIKRRYKREEIDLSAVERDVDKIDSRVRTTIRQLQKQYPKEAEPLGGLRAAFDEMKEYFLQAKERAIQVENEHQRMLQLAGVGLMLEVVAHELARATENTLKILNSASATDLPKDIAALFRTLQAEIKSMNKRLRVLDPLSVSGRQRKETFDFVDMVKDILDARGPQFLRHNIKIEASCGTKVLIHGVKGMFVQILENLISNSVYWLSLRSKAEDDFSPVISIKIGSPPTVLEFTDNGPGIAPDLFEQVFKPFFSTKDRKRRQGLGLYIARECATYHSGELILSQERKIHNNRLNTFILELPKDTITI